MNRTLSIICLSLFSLCADAAVGGSAFGRPGMVPTWASAKKVQIGTSFERKSKLWFTNTDGILTETYFPQIDRPQIKDSQIIVSDGKSFFADEKKKTHHRVKKLSPYSSQLINIDKKNRFKIAHTYFTFVDRAVLVDEIEITSYKDGLSYYLLVNPHLENTGFGDNGRAFKDRLHFYQDSTSLDVSSSTGFEKSSVGFVGSSDGYQDLEKNYQMNYLFKEALDGNIAGMAKFKIPSIKGKYKLYVVYNFSGKKIDFKLVNFESEKKHYYSGWKSYLSSLKVPMGLSSSENYLYQRSLFVIKSSEDKKQPGALIASLSKPWGDKIKEHSGVMTGGYHLVWPRDLFHISMALLYSGDHKTALNALRFLKKIQYRSGSWNYQKRVISKKGAFPQNTWISGKEYWSGLQIDQVGYPVHLFFHLYKGAPAKVKKRLLAEFKEMLILACDFIQSYGPWTGQERWEENYGISPSSFAVAASALKIGADLLGNSTYAHTASGWLGKKGDNIHTWTYTTSGVYGDGKYYLRVGACSHPLEKWNPNAKNLCTVANSGKQVNPQEILDGGFLKLSLLGLVDPEDTRILSTLNKVNKHISFDSDRGTGWLRYSFDAYGEGKKGELWPLLSGEHGRFDIELGNKRKVAWSVTKSLVDQRLKDFQRFSNKGGMIPEQVYRDTGLGTGAATPLAWSHAEYIKLLWSRQLRYNIENPF
ncbi:MAG: hypothetical protein HOE90_17495 [Bacteriovoracaceae bacterium]|jgi:glucoamylase|nr:hypothetical protein [Bacteriovoracaceae bacterium]